MTLVRIGAGLLLSLTSPVVVLPVFAQQDARSPAFEVATIAPAASGAGGQRGGIRLLPGGRLTATNVTFRELIQWAYRRHGFDRREVSGGPAWIDSDRFDVDAKAASEHVIDPDGSPRQTWSMLQTLLAEKFKLSVRTKSTERPVYVLTMAAQDRNPGPRLRPSDVDCGAVFRSLLKGDRPAQPLCAVASYPGRLVASAFTTEALASVLSETVGRIVIDRTGLRGNFDLELEAVEIRPPGPFGPSYRPSDTTQSIFTALPEQLGLMLESTTGPVDILVIDRAERPTSK